MKFHQETFESRRRKGLEEKRSVEEIAREKGK